MARAHLVRHHAAVTTAPRADPGVTFALPERSEPTGPRWASRAWQEATTRWVAEHLARLGAREEPRVQVVHLRPWSVVLTADCDLGRFWLKENCTGQNFEAGLVGVLHEVVPDRVLQPVALDPARGLLLTQDQGSVLRDSGSRDDLAVWCRVVAEWAALQRALLDHEPALRQAGVVELPTSLSRRVAEERGRLLHDLPHGDPRRLDDETHQAVLGTLDGLDACAEQVLALGLPVALNHNDLHDNNVFDTPQGRPFRFFDFGDCLLTDPLGALRVPLGVVGYYLDCGTDDPRVARVADAFLEVWSDLAPSSALRAALPAALHIGKLARHESWVRCLPSMTDDELVEVGPYAGQWLGRLAEDD